MLNVSFNKSLLYFLYNNFYYYFCTSSDNRDTTTFVLICQIRVFETFVIYTLYKGNILFSIELKIVQKITINVLYYNNILLLEFLYNDTVLCCDMLRIT